MLRRFFQSRLFSKVFYELLPAAVVSVLGTFLISKYARPTDPPPQPVAAAAANAELVLLLREQQALLADYLKKTAEAHQGTGTGAVPDAETLKAAERTAAQALRQAKAAETRALATARVSTEAPERKVVRQPLQQPEKLTPEKAPVGEPLQLHPAVSAVTPAPPPPQIAAPVAPPSPPRENAAVSTLRDAVSTIERIPSRIVDWFSEGAPPRPPADLPQRNFMKVAM
jgi:hypothetical protein